MSYVVNIIIVMVPYLSNLDQPFIISIGIIKAAFKDFIGTRFEFYSCFYFLLFFYESFVKRGLVL